MTHSHPPVALDVKAFWAENAAASGKPFRTDKPRAPVSYWLDDHWLLEHVNPPSWLRYYREPEYAAALHRQVNAQTDEHLGIRCFRETPAPPPILRIEHVLGAHTEIIEGGTPWLEPGLHTVEELRAKLDALSDLDDNGLRALLFSTGGVVETVQPESDGRRPRRSVWSRGPATMATSVIGTTELMYWLVDYPAEMRRFFEVMADVIIRYQRVVAAAGGYEIAGYGWLDDNCALFSPELYTEFCLPVMQRVFAAFAPAPGDWRYQHSDSDMAHLLPILNTLNFKAVNLGPRIPAETIRAAMPRTEIHGQVAPFTLRNQPTEAIIAEVRRDFAAVGADGGLTVATAGSVAGGTSFEAIRTFMWAVQAYCRYDKPRVG